MDKKIHESFIEYLKHLIATNQVSGNIPAQIKPIVIAHFYNVEVYRSGIQSFFEVYPFSLEEVLNAFQILGVAPELIRVVEEANLHEYLTDDELYEQEPDDEEKYEQLMEERDLLWDNINEKYRGIANNDVDERITDYIKTHNLDFSVD